MNASVRHPPTLNEQEWALVIELLEREQSELRPEIHHTNNSVYREQLRGRKRMVESLLTRLRQE